MASKINGLVNYWFAYASLPSLSPSKQGPEVLKPTADDRTTSSPLT